MPMTLKDFVLVLHLVQNGHHTVQNVFITTPDASWQLPIQWFAYCFGAEIGKKNPMEYWYKYREKFKL